MGAIRVSLRVTTGPWSLVAWYDAVRSVNALSRECGLSEVYRD